MNHQDSGTIIVTFLLLLPWLGRAAVLAVALGREHIERKAGKQNKTSEANFPRNLAPAFTHYFSERPEMSSQ